MANYAENNSRNSKRNKFIGGFSMFIDKKKYVSLKEENEELKQKLDSLLDELKQREKDSQVFVDSFDQDLTMTVNQHELVNSQHHVMGNLVTKIKERFDRVNDLSQNSSSQT